MYYWIFLIVLLSLFSNFSANFFIFHRGRNQEIIDLLIQCLTFGTDVLLVQFLVHRLQNLLWVYDSREIYDLEKSVISPSFGHMIFIEKFVNSSIPIAKYLVTNLVISVPL